MQNTFPIQPGNSAGDTENSMTKCSGSVLQLSTVAKLQDKHRKFKCRIGT